MSGSEKFEWFVLGVASAAFFVAVFQSITMIVLRRRRRRRWRRMRQRRKAEAGG